jgi:hypothetical protein
MIYQKLLFTKQECDLIKSYANLQPENLQDYFNISNKFNFVDGNKIISTNTSYRVYVILNTTKTHWMFDRLLKWFSETNNIKINHNNKIERCTLHQYTVGDEFTKHIDLVKEFDKRRYNLGIQLNDSYEGGEYMCWDENNNEILISKETGTAVSYHCKILHEIKQITKGERWSIVMPIKKQNIIENINLI